MSFQGGFADGFGTVVAPEEPPPGPGGGGVVLLPRVWRPWAPPPLPERVKAAVRLRLVPRMRVRVLGLRLPPSKMARAARRDREEIEILEALLAWQALDGGGSWEIEIE